MGPRSKRRTAKRPTCPWCNRRAQASLPVYALRHRRGGLRFYCSYAHAIWAGSGMWMAEDWPVWGHRELPGV